MERESLDNCFGGLNMKERRETKSSGAENCPQQKKKQRERKRKGKSI